MSETLCPTTPPVEPGVPALDPTPIRDRIMSLSDQEVENRRNEILAAAKGDYESLSTEMLHELACISQRLRRTNVGPPKEPKGSKAKVAKSIDDLL